MEAYVLILRVPKLQVKRKSLILYIVIVVVDMLICQLYSSPLLRA